MMRAVKRLLSGIGADQRGVAAVEFAMIAPVFFGLLIGIIDVGRYMWTLNTMQYAIDQGVRSGVVQQLPEEDVTDVVKKSLAGLNASAIDVDVTADAASLSVAAVTDYAFLFPISMFMKGTTISLRSEMPK
jgi:Flp pilus assembly protein TadG